MSYLETLDAYLRHPPLSSKGSDIRIILSRIGTFINFYRLDFYSMSYQLHNEEVASRGRHCFLHRHSVVVSTSICSVCHPQKCAGKVWLLIVG